MFLLLRVLLVSRQLKNLGFDPALPLLLLSKVEVLLEAQITNNRIRIEIIR